MKHFYRYLPLSDEVRSRSLYVIAGGYTLIPAHRPYPPVSHPSDHDFQWRLGRTLQEYQLIYITRGAGVFESAAGGLHRIAAGEVFLLFPGEWHRYSPDPETGWDEYWVAFGGAMADQIVAEYSLSPSDPVLRLQVDAGLMSDFIHLTQEMGEEAMGYQSVVAARALLILAHAAALALRQSFTGTEILGVIERAKCLLLEQTDHPVNVEEMARDLGVGYSRFRRAFREYTGLSPSQYHLQLRINRACELLRTTTMPIALVGEQAGFESSYYFARIFREKTGKTPRDYRALAQSRAGAPVHD